MTMDYFWRHFRLFIAAPMMVCLQLVFSSHGSRLKPRSTFRARVAARIIEG